MTYVIGRKQKDVNANEYQSVTPYVWVRNLQQALKFPTIGDLLKCVVENRYLGFINLNGNHYFIERVEKKVIEALEVTERIE